MMTSERVVEVSQEIEATPEAAFRALTHPLELSYWFCHHAWAEAEPGGDFVVRWRNGWWARGVFQALEPSRRVVWSWQGKDEPGETQVNFEIKPLDKGIKLQVVHSGFEDDAVWDKAVVEAEQSWPNALANLASVLTTGIDLREVNRPMLGIIPQALTSELAAKAGLTIERGIHLAGVPEGGAAAEAGLQKGDVITSIDGMAVTNADTLLTTLARYRAGNQVRVGYVRGNERGTVMVELKPRPVPEVFADPQQIVEQVREEQATVMQTLRELVAGLSEEQAETRPAPDEWSVKEILAHLSHSERLTQHRFCDIIVGTTRGQVGGDNNNVPEMFAMVFAVAPTVDALLVRLQQELSETLALFAALRPEIVALKVRYRQMASELQFWSFHARDHVNQIEATIEAIQG